MRNSLASLMLLLSVCACGERPQRLGKEGAAPTPSAGSATPQKVEHAPRFSGTIDLEGSLAGVEGGALFVSARRKGQRLPTLSRKYDIGGPGWTTREGHRELQFALTDDDNMGGFGAPMGGEMEVEARYSPSGFIDPRPGSEEEGSVRASTPASPGEAKLTLKLQANSGK